MATCSTTTPARSAATATRRSSRRSGSPATPQPLKLPNGNVLNNDAGEICGNGHPPVIQAFWLSCNTAFGELGIKIGGPTLRQYAEKFGMNHSHLTIPL